MDPIVEDFVPYRRSVLWQIHDLYYARRGVAAFTDGEIPWKTTNNAGLARQYAALMIAIAGTRAADAELTVVEIGAGSGVLAANILAALELDCGDDGRRLYARLRYVLTDFVATTVEAATAAPALRTHVARGRIVPAQLDGRTRDRPRALAGGAELPRADLVIANYIACVCPTTYLRSIGGVASEMHVQLRAPADADPESVPGGPAELVDAYRRDAALTIKQYERVYDWRPTATGSPFDDPFHARVLARLFADGDATVAYPYGMLDLLRGLDAWLAADGLVLLTDFGSPARSAAAGTPEPRPALYGDSLNHAVQFATFDAFAFELGWDLTRTDDPLRAVQQVLLSKPRIAPVIARAFADNLVARQDGADLLDDIAVARILVKDNAFTRAARFYARALALDPRSAELHFEMGETCIAAGEPLLAIEHLSRCATLDVGHAFDHAFQLGVACFSLDRYADAIAHYERSLARDPHHVTWWNIALAHRALGDLTRTVQALNRALALDPTYEPAAQMAQEIRDEWWRTLVGSSP